MTINYCEQEQIDLHFLKIYDNRVKQSVNIQSQDIQQQYPSYEIKMLKVNKNQNNQIFQRGRLEIKIPKLKLKNQLIDRKQMTQNTLNKNDLKLKNQLIDRKQMTQNTLNKNDLKSIYRRSVITPSIRFEKIDSFSQKSGNQRTIDSGSNCSNPQSQFLNVIHATIDYYKQEQQLDYKKRQEQLEDEMFKKQQKIFLLNSKIRQTQQIVNDLQEANKRAQNDFAILKYVTLKEKNKKVNQKQIIKDLQKQLKEKQDQIHDLHNKLGKELQVTDNMSNAIRRILQQTQEQLQENPPISIRRIAAQKQFLYLKNQYEVAKEELSKAKQVYDVMSLVYNKKSEQLNTIQRNYEQEKKYRLKLQEIRKSRFLSSLSSDISVQPNTVRELINLSIPNTDR